MSTLKVNTLTDTAATKSVPIEDVVNGPARAWVNFNGTGTVAIRAQYNVSSITDNGTGNYTVNFTNAMPDANFCAGGAVMREVTTGGGIHVPITYATGSYQFVVRNVSNALADGENNNIIIFR